MNWLSPLLLAIQVFTSLSIIVLVLLQQGKGSEMGSAFGSGSAGSLFGASGAANFLSRLTKWAAILFFLSTIGLAYTAHRTGDSILEGGLMQDYQAPPPASSGSSVPTVPGIGSGEVPQVPGASAVPSAPADVPAAPAEVPAASAEAPAAPQAGSGAVSDASAPTAPAASAEAPAAESNAGASTGSSGQ